MNIRTIIKSLATGIVAASLPVLAHAQVCQGGQLPVTVSPPPATFGPFSGLWRSATSSAPGGGDVVNVADLQLPKFDPSNFPPGTIPAGATLIRAEFQARVRLTSQGFMNNAPQADSTCSGTWGGQVDATIESPGIAALEPYLSCAKTAERTEPYSVPIGNQVNFPLQTSTGNCPTVNPGNSIQPVIIVGAALADFEGPGTIGFAHNGGVFKIDTGLCGFSTAQHILTAYIEIFINYVYCTEGGDDPQCPCVGPSPHYRRPGSLLLFPEFDNREGSFTLATVTNTKCDGDGGDVRIEFRFYDENTCTKQDASRNLTACDTFSAITWNLNPQRRRGFFYVFAKDAQDNPIVWNHLIGNVLILSALDEFDYSMNAVAFRGIGDVLGVEQVDGTHTDLNSNTHLDLDGKEYEPAPDSITIPRYFGQDDYNSDLGGGGPVPNLFSSQLILVALSGGRQFDTTVDFCIFNDNEEAFSSEWTFRCWDKPYLRDITFLFNNDFLKLTDHAENEILGASERESGWMIIDGAIANSVAAEIENPAIYAVLVERVGRYAAADLPWECGVRLNGRLYPASNDGE